MPHVVIKMYPGRNDEIKENLAKKVASGIAEELKIDIGKV